ncbi:MAG: gliding motility-associated C-terminal domain-containing protein [Flavobacteriales bacterium]
MKFFTSLCILSILIACPTLGDAQGVTPTKGKDFWLGFMKNYEVEFGESLDLFIVSDQATSGVVEVPGQGWSQAFTVLPNLTTTVTIPNNIAEVYSSQVIEPKGVHVTTEDTVAVFAISFNSYTADASKILPTPTLGIEYMAASYVGLSGYDSEMLIVATKDGTQIEIIPSTTTQAGDPAGVPFTIDLNTGECYQIRAQAGGDLTGTTAIGTEANGTCRPFAVFSGTDCTNLPTGCIACDHIFDENFPIPLWGTEYYVTPWVFVLSAGWAVDAPNYTYRILASEDNTQVTVDGGAPFTLDAGEFEEYQFEEVAHCVQASNPVAVIEYMEGISCGGNGDPAMLVLDDVEKKIDNITFSTVESTVITSHYLNIVIDATDIGNVTLDGVVIDPALFQSFTNCDSQVWCGIQITEGSHTLDAPGGGVTGYVYGNGEAESYAYSVGSFSPVPPIIIDEALCTNDAVILQISQVFYDPYWYNYTSPDDTLFEGYNYELPLPIQNGIYVGVGSEVASGCQEPFYFSVEVPEPPDLEVSPDATICQYESVQLFAQALPESGVYTYEWTPTSGLSDPNIANPVATPLETTTYTVTVTTPTGCATNQGSVTITVNGGQITSVEASPEEVLFCTGDGEQLDVVTEDLAWSEDFDPSISMANWEAVTNGTANSTCGSVDGNGLYFNGGAPREAITNGIDVTDGGNVYFSLKVANGIAPCDNAEPGDNIVLAYSNNNGPWVDIQTYYEAAYPNFTSVSAEIPAGAFGTNTRFRWQQVGTFANNQDNWVLDNVYVGAINTEDYDYTWTPSAGLDQNDISNPLASPSVTTTYYVEMTDTQTGCTYTDSVFVNVGQPFVLDMTPDTSVCDVQGIQLQATPDVPGDYDYVWTPGTNINNAFGATPIVTPTSTTTYDVTVTSEQGCTSTGSVQIAVGVLLDLEVTASDQSICAGETITLEADLVGNPPGVSFLWTPSTSVVNSTSAITDASPVVNTTYTCTVTHDESGCSLSDDVAISVLQVFTVDAIPEDTALCITQGLELVATPSVGGQLTWSWSPAALVNPSNLPVTNMTSNTSAELIVTATNQAGCSAKDTIYVTQIIELTDLGPDTGFCEDQDVTLDTGWPEEYDIQWSTGDNTSAITVNQTGVYSVDVTSPDGCYSTDEVIVDVYSYPVVELGEDTAMCVPATYEIMAPGGDGYNYNWSTGDTTQAIIASQSGVYSVTVDNDYCFTSDQIVLVFNPLPTNPFAETTEFCFGYPPYVLDLDAMNPGSQYIWSTGYTGQIYGAMAPGFVTVLVTTPFECVDEFQIEITEQCPGSLYIPNSFSPNGDGINDVWFVKGENIAEFELKLYNRWGELFWETKSENQPWTGQRRSDGEYYVEAGVYPFIVTFKLYDENGAVSDELQYKGHVTLVR